MKPLLLCSLVVVLTVASGCKPDDARAEASPPAGTTEGGPLKARAESRIRVEVAKVEPSGAGLTFTFPGEVEGSRDALLAAALGGYVEAVLVKQGDRVKKGTPLLRVDSSIHGARLEQARADHAQAQTDAERVRSMGDAVARAQKEQAETRLRIAEAGLKLAQAQYSRSVVTAPFDGVVAQLGPEVGEVTAPGAPVGRLVQLDPVKVSVSVSDRDISALKVGLPVNITTDSLRDVLAGKVSFVSPAADLRTRSFRAEVETTNPDQKLLPGMIARVQVNAQRDEGAVVIPQDVVVTQMKEVGVFVADGTTAKWRPLKLGAIVGQQVVVEEGLSPGERVVVNGHRELADGDLLDVAREGECCKRGRVLWADEGTRQ